MLFRYDAVDNDGNKKTGKIDAVSKDVAVSSLQRRGLVVSKVERAEKKPFWQKDITLFEHISNRDVVVLSRQIATLFEAQVSPLRVFRLLAEESDDPAIKKRLAAVADDLQAGNTIAKSLEKHPDMFSDFYVNMVRAGEETGNLEKSFSDLADYLERTYELMSKARNALIYPAFVITTFIVVMVLMLTIVIPRLKDILQDTGGDLPIYTTAVIGISEFLVNYGIFLLAGLLLAAVGVWRYINTEEGRLVVSELKYSVPYVGSLYRRLYLSRLADVLATSLTSGIQVVRGLEISKSVISDRTYEDILDVAISDVKGGSSLSQSLGQYDEVPGVMTGMMKVGEETGELGYILKTLSKFYRREVENAVDNLVNLIEPMMIVLLGLGVGFLLASVLLPLYNISAGI
jgi:type IV pilus assembly protein PilC